MSAQPFRLAHRGRIDRSRTLRFRFDDADLEGHPGDTLASALLAGGVHQVGTSVRFGRPRGVFSAGSEEPNAVVQVERPFHEPMVTATTLELHDGLVARGLSGRGRLATEPDPARYDTMHAHCDLLVVGAGPAGLAAAAAAARSGARVLVADEQSEPGGSLLGTTDRLDGAPALDWVARVATDLAGADDVRVLPRTTVVAYHDHNYLLAVERRTARLGGDAPAHVSRERLWRIRAGRVVLATGSHERHLAFAGNDLPGVMLAASARAYVNRWGVLPGRRPVVFTTNDSAYVVAVELADAGADGVVVVDVRESAGPDARRRCAEHDIEVLAGHEVTDVGGGARVATVRVARRGDRTTSGRELDADLLLVSGGWNPVTHLFTQAGGRIGYDPAAGAFLPEGCRQAVEVSGAARGATDLAACLDDGAAAGGRAVAATGLEAPAPLPLPRAEPVESASGETVWLVAGDSAYDRHFVDLQRDVTVADALRATGAGLRSVEHVKRFTTACTAHDQGKTSGVLMTGVVADALGLDPAGLGTTRARPPYTPVSFATLAGRDRGRLHDPVRVTSIHGWHVSHGAALENVGQWKRPWFYPRSGEDKETAALRECTAARRGVAFMDASTLGKIDVQGPDAAEFLDRIYTNLMSSLAVGSIRYGVMCRADGMVFDDGTAFRLADDRYLVTTTTGNAAAVLDWMEEWLQTEWPHLRVRLTSVTEQWATVAVVGPRSRDVLARLAPDLSVDKDSFPFMTWRDCSVAGLTARVARISFSGELAFEVNVPWWDGPALWEAVESAGEPFGITPYGTETMHVLRAEKGYPIVGQDTDGTVTPQDLGMGWVVSKKKADFVGKRSFARPDTSRADRKQLVGLLPEEPQRLLPEGSQLVEAAVLPPPPVPMLGHVTSSYRSAALGRTFALALLRDGRAREGDLLHVPVGSDVVPVRVTGPVLYDPEGTRRDG